MTETQLLGVLFIRAPAEIPDVRLFRRNVGVYRSLDGKRVIRVAVEGQADVYAKLRGGSSVEIEAKSATGDLSPEQRNWQACCVAWGWPHVVLQAMARERPDETVGRWIEELRGVFAALMRKP